MLETPLVALTQSSGASFAVFLWEYVITFDDEVAFIWPKSNVSWLKWSYFCARYLVLAVHLTNRFLELSYMNDYNFSKAILRGWYAGQVMMMVVAISSLELVLMARLYALYNQPRWLAILLLATLLCEVGLAVLGLVLTFPNYEDFIPSMIITSLPASFAYYEIASVVVHSALLAFTVRRYKHSSLSGIPLVRLMVRDGTFAFSMITIFGLTVVVHTLQRYPYAATAYAWLLTSVSCVTCRLIVNMQRIPLSSEDDDTSTTMIFTTIFTDRITILDDFNSIYGRHGRSRQTARFLSSTT